MIRDQEIFAKKEVQLAGREYAILPAVIDRVDDHEQIRGEPVFLLGCVFLDFGRRTDHDAIFNRERMKMKDVLEDKFGFFWRWMLEVYPQK